MWTDVKVRHGEDGKKCITVLRKRLHKKHKAKQHQEIKVEDTVMVKGEDKQQRKWKIGVINYKLYPVKYDEMRIIHVKTS